MQMFVDTSVWVRFLDRDDPESMPARGWILGARSSGIHPVISPQVCREVWSVLGRPKDANGLKLSVGDVSDRIQICLQIAELAHELEHQFEQWLRLVHAYSVSGKQVHDANHIAFMLSHGITDVLTLDRRDFDRYVPEGVKILTVENTP